MESRKEYEGEQLVQDSLSLLNVAMVETNWQKYYRLITQWTQRAVVTGEQTEA
jgi:hypothetical protein